MIPLDRRQHRQHAACYDAEGNIILPMEASTVPVEQIVKPILQKPMEQQVEKALPKEKKGRVPSWFPLLKSTVTSLPSHATTNAGALLQESVRQYRQSAVGCKTLTERMTRSVKEAFRCFWAFLVQPVWVVRPRREPKRYSRITLFLIDTVRFGGTFSALFVALFVSLNYQSFWQIIQSRLDPLQEIRTETSLGAGTTAELREKLLKSPMLTTAGGQDEGSLLSFLPPVGPPENRLIIPKLNLNVPIVIPSYEALLREDWTQVESDIQQSLEQGVVHYPGTAKPGQAGNFFVTGHSSYYPWAPGNFKTVFARLHMLSEGDDYWVYYGGDKHRYVVQSVAEVKPSNVDVLDQPADRRLSTLMTCTPVGTTLRRLIVSAEEVDPETGEPLAVGQQPVREQPKYKMEMLPI
ncbi:MAG: sortase [Candidatus Peribacteraceae bacterium]|nr:sortase [Candidatus Peribacteraceae bacterium]MDD5742655.1 sortase [Candidatus Peribacteraceae bacterium]